MRIERFDPAADPGKVRACYELYVSAQAVDDPVVPPMSLPVFSGWFIRGWDADPREAWLARGDEADPWAGACLLELPARENKHMARLAIVVAPAMRRRGIGTALLRHAAARAAGQGRTVLTGDAKDGAPGSAFAAAAGASRGVTEVRRVLHLADVPPGHLDSLRRQAEDAARGYSLVSWRGPCPEEHLDQVAAVISAMADAPHNPGEEPERLDAQRLRDGKALQAIRKDRRYSVAARCDLTGELVGLTIMAVDPPRPDWAYQQVTAVVRAHRGHRLGLLVKVAMMDWLAETEPALEHIVTGNSATNRHMIAINAELGYRVLDEWPSWQLDVARVAGDPAARPPARAELR